jgi:hypothetical protein
MFTSTWIWCLLLPVQQSAADLLASADAPRYLDPAIVYNASVPASPLRHTHLTPSTWVAAGYTAEGDINEVRPAQAVGSQGSNVPKHRRVCYACPCFCHL